MGLSISETISRPLKKFLSQTASLAAYEAATYSASMVESVMLDRLMLLQTIAPPPRVNTDPDVNFEESLSAWKSESVYPNIVPHSPKILEDVSQALNILDQGLIGTD